MIVKLVFLKIFIKETFLNFKEHKMCTRYHYTYRMVHLSINLNLAMHMSFYSVTKFSILSPLNIMNRFQIDQRWDLMEIYGVFFSAKKMSPSYKVH